MAKKYYVVWKGSKTGVFDNWATVQAATVGRSDAQFMGFESQALAQEAFTTTYTKALMRRSLEKGNTGQSKVSTNTRKVTNTAKTSPALPKQTADVAIYCDGACSPNPGKSGTGLAVYHKNKLTELWYGLYDAHGTNNTAELNGMLAAFRLAKPFIEKNQHVEILSDSKYSIDSITKWAAGWQRKGWKKANGEGIKNPEIVQACFSLYQQIKSNVTISHVKGHANIEGNELSDRMAVQARLKQTTGLEKYTETMDIKLILAMASG